MENIHVNDVQNVKMNLKQNVDSRGPEPPYSPFEVHIAEGNIPSTNLLMFIGNGADVVSSVKQTLISPLDMAIHLMARHWRTKTLPVSKSRFMMLVKRVVDSVGFFTSGIGLEHTYAQQKRTAPIKRCFSQGERRFFSLSVSVVDMSSMS